jgi:hypothetical protein
VRRRLENDRVRVLEYRDEPGARTSPHDHVASVMATLTGFDRRVSPGAQSRDVTLRAGEVRWLDAQTHAGENIGSTPSHAFFIELKGERPAPSTASPLGPSS